MPNIFLIHTQKSQLLLWIFWNPRTQTLLLFIFVERSLQPRAACHCWGSLYKVLWLRVIEESCGSSFVVWAASPWRVLRVFSCWVQDCVSLWVGCALIHCRFLYVIVSCGLYIHSEIKVLPERGFFLNSVSQHIFCVTCFIYLSVDTRTLDEWLGAEIK